MYVELLEPRMLLALPAMLPTLPPPPPSSPLPIHGIVACSVIKSGEVLSILTRANEVWIGETKASSFDVVCFDPDSIDITFQHKFSGVRVLNVVGGVEADYIGFDLRGITPVLISVSANAGDDTLEMTFSKVVAPITISANMGAGDDWVSVTIEENVAAPFTIKTTMGAGDDYVEVVCYGQITGGLTTIVAAGDVGNDEFGIFVESKRQAKLPIVRIDGGAGIDALAIDDFMENRLFASQIERWVVLPNCDLDDVFAGVC